MTDNLPKDFVERLSKCLTLARLCSIACNSLDGTEALIIAGGLDQLVDQIDSAHTHACHAFCGRQEGGQQ